MYRPGPQPRRKARRTPRNPGFQNPTFRATPVRGSLFSCVPAKARADQSRTEVITMLHRIYARLVKLYLTGR